MNKEDYNAEPVYYCKTCRSLAVMIYSENTNYCNECGSTKITTTSIENWKVLYEAKYGKSFLESK